MNLKLKTPPQEAPLSLDLVKAHLRLSDPSEDAYLEHLIKTACAQIELLTNRCLITQIWELMIHEPGIHIRLPLAPVQKIKSIHWMTSRGDKLSIGMDKTKIDNKQDGPILQMLNPIFGQAKIQFVVGYGDHVSDVPSNLKHALLLLVAHYYENRGDHNQKLPEEVFNLVQPYIYHRIGL